MSRKSQTFSITIPPEYEGPQERAQYYEWYKFNQISTCLFFKKYDEIIRLQRSWCKTDIDLNPIVWYDVTIPVNQILYTIHAGIQQKEQNIFEMTLSVKPVLTQLQLWVVWINLIHPENRCRDLSRKVEGAGDEFQCVRFQWPNETGFREYMVSGLIYLKISCNGD